MPPAETPTETLGWSQALGSNAGAAPASSSRGFATDRATQRRRTDEQLARAAGRGDVAAFEALYERHHLALLAFARHMLARPHDAEDVVQHAFAAADRAFRAGKVPRSVRAWLFAVARNRCVSVLRARREDVGLPDAGVPSMENLAAEVEQREDLRHLLADLRALPETQRAALLLAELGELSHAEVAQVIGVRPGKVKALVFQAREALMASARARSIPCHAIREELAVASGAELRRRHLRHHLAQCPGCTEYAASVRAQRASLAVILPVVPSVALREGVLAGLSGGAAATGAGAGVGVLAAKSTAAKLLTIAAVGGAAAGGGTVAVTSQDAPERPRAAAGPSAQRAPTAAAPAVARSLAPPAVARERPAASRLDEARSGRAGRPPRQSADNKAAPGLAKKQAGGVPPGQAKKQAGGVPPGHAKKQAGAGAPNRAKPPKVAKPPDSGAPRAGAQPPKVEKSPKSAPPKPAKVPKAAAPPKSAKPAKPEPGAQSAAPAAEEQPAPGRQRQ